MDWWGIWESTYSSTFKYEVMQQYKRPYGVSSLKQIGVGTGLEDTV